MLIILPKKIIIGTRGSRLALWQAHFIQEKITELGVEVELKIIKTRGDQIQHLGFDKMEGKGFFTKEIEDAMLRGDIDMAVHSMKDLPTTQPEGLCIAAVSYREDPADWLLIRKEAIDDTQTYRFKQGAKVGTSSARRKAQIKHFRPDITLEDIRGNVPTRIEKLRSGQFDVILLAAAGMRRLEITPEDIEIIKLNPREFVPSPAQGVLAFQTRTNDLDLRRFLKQVHHSEVSAVTNVERKVLKLFGGGCHVPLGVYCQRDGMNNYHVWAARAESWDAPVVRTQVSSSTSFELAEKVLAELNQQTK